MCDVILRVGLLSERAAFISVGRHSFKFAAELGQWGAARAIAIGVLVGDNVFVAAILIIITCDSDAAHLPPLN